VFQVNKVLVCGLNGRRFEHFPVAFGPRQSCGVGCYYLSDNLRDILQSFLAGTKLLSTVVGPLNCF